MKSFLRLLGLAVIVLGLGSQAARGIEWCYGNCTVTCDDGSNHLYYTRSWECCEHADACGGTAQWWPGYGVACREELAFIC